jgi:hypothetical protein
VLDMLSPSGSITSEMVPNSPSPIFLSLPLHGWGGGVLALDPMARAARQVGRAESLRHDPFEAELAGMAENEVASLSDVFIQLHGPGGFADQLGKYSLVLL